MKLIDQFRREPARVAFSRGPSAAPGSVTNINLDSTRDADQVTITADDGSFVVIPAATDTTAGIFTADDKSRLDTLVAETKAVAEASTPPAVQNFLRTAGYYAAGDGGGALYRRVASQPGHALWLQTADLAYWELVPEKGEVNVLQAGARGDGVADDAPAIMAAIEAFAGVHGSSSQSITVLIPPVDQHYRCASTLNLKHQVRLIGAGHVNDKAQLIFDADITGIIVNLSNTTMDTIDSPSTTTASWTTLENISIDSLGGTDATAHGIRLRGPAYLRQVVVRGFPGNGFEIRAKAVNATNSELGNANVFMLESCKSRYNGLNGLHLEGDDANAGSVVNFDAILNGRYGIHDDSLLGNFYFGLHLATNGNPGYGYNSSSESCRASYNGKRYHAVWSATEAQLAATQPGTDENVWRYYADGGTDSNHIAWTGSEPIGTFFPGGAAAFTDVNARSFITGYTESDQAPVYIGQRSVWFGGLNAADAYGLGTWFNGVDYGLGGISLAQRMDLDSRQLTLDLRNSPDAFWRAIAEGDDVKGLALKWHEPTGVFRLVHGDLDARRGIEVSSEITTHEAGTGAPIAAGVPFLPLGVVLGSGTNGRMINYASAPPSTGAHARGEIRFNRSPNAGGSVGWICVTAGAPGTWKAFGSIDP